MSEKLLKLYHRLPPAAQNAAASLYGLRLRRQRYGPGTDDLVAEALERDTWPPDRRRRWEEERLAFILHRAATRVPYYRDLWSRRRRQGDRRSWEHLEHWPVLEKDEVRKNGFSLVADDQAERSMTVERTSGTTGTPLALWRSRRTLRAGFALYEARRLRWNGVDRHDRWGLLAGQLVTPYARRKPPFWVWNRPLRQLYLSSYHLSPEFAPAYVEALGRYKVRYLLGYPSSIDSIARALEPGGAAHLCLKAVITIAEPLYDHQREAIELVFACPVRETYGATELACGASECTCRRLHLWPDLGVCEVGHGEDGLSCQGRGELIATSLLDADMPLIRYRLGDTVTLAARDCQCPCGRTLPVLDSVEGRSDDILHTREGRPVGRLDPVFKAGLRVREAQIIQESLDLIRVRLVAGEGYSDGDSVAIRRAVRERMGDVRVLIEPVAKIPRSRNGKLRAVISKLPPQSPVKPAQLARAAAGTR